MVSPEAIAVIYGKKYTDSTHESLRPKHNVVNVFQAFEVMKYLVGMINSTFPEGKMLKFEDEKIADRMILYQMKNYHMRARIKIEKHKVKYLRDPENRILCLS